MGLKRSPKQGGGIHPSGSCASANGSPPPARFLPRSPRALSLPATRASSVPATPPRAEHPDHARCGRLIAKFDQTNGPPVAASLDERTSGCGQVVDELTREASASECRTRIGRPEDRLSKDRHARTSLRHQPPGALDRHHDGSPASCASPRPDKPALRPRPGDTRLLLTSPFRPASLSWSRNVIQKRPGRTAYLKAFQGSLRETAISLLQRPHQPLLSGRFDPRPITRGPNQVDNQWVRLPHRVIRCTCPSG